MFVYHIFMTIPLGLVVGPQSLQGGFPAYLQILNMCPFDYMAVAVIGKIERSSTVLTTPVRWLLLLQPTVLSRSAIIVCLKFLVALFMLSRFLDFLWV